MKPKQSVSNRLDRRLYIKSKLSHERRYSSGIIDVALKDSI